MTTTMTRSMTNWLLLGVCLISAASSVAQTSTKKKSAPVRRKITVKAPPPGSPETEGVEGYIIRKTPEGYIKVPRKQTFKFSGSDVEGEGVRPNESSFGQRPQVRENSLIPVRQSFRPELLETVGIRPGTPARR